ncbi:hypothetical protein EPUS_00543 [Endocarpon pusillum Z07020]|uniref:Uncharacterized protein n=1 Tax=Endocarpon pusillum (strain Z07020 / HMAS-L-300199) TaxID=1263415 RepID=U1HR19_ENDPU|nr:uncharacterized protein EPUS_00543 [Endocarpon pusillum Z07020]ERF71554.1 hypothetical protein EPUS_00543 [Endocarpon pusillum Z07020]
MANNRVVKYVFVFLTAILGPSKLVLSPDEVAKYLQWEIYLRILESFYDHLLGEPKAYVTQALKLWTANGLLSMRNGTACSWRSLRVLSDYISRARQYLREAEADTRSPLPTPHKDTLKRLAILMHQMGQAPPPAANLPVIEGVVPMQPLLRLAPPTPVQDDSEDSYGDDGFNGFSDDSAGG